MTTVRSLLEPSLGFCLNLTEFSYSSVSVYCPRMRALKSVRNCGQGIHPHGKCSLKVSSVNMRLMYEDLQSAGVTIAGEPAPGGNVGIAY